MDKTKPNILTYYNYRSFIHDWFDWMKNSRQSITHRDFAKAAGFQSPNYLQLIMKKQRNLNPAKALPVGIAMGLKKFEQSYFELLVKFDQAQTIQLRSTYAKELVKIRKKQGDETLPDELFQLYSEAHLIHLREMIALPGFKEDLSWIKKNLNFDLSEKKIRDSIEKLIQLGFLLRNKDGKLKQRNKVIESGSEILSTALFNYQQSMIEGALNAMESLPGDKREMSSVTACLSWNSLKIVKNKIAELRKEILELEKNERDAEDVFQVNLQVFPTTSCKFNNK